MPNLTRLVQSLKEPASHAFARACALAMAALAVVLLIVLTACDPTDPAPMAPDCYTDPSLCEDEADASCGGDESEAVEAAEADSEKHGAQGANTLHAGTGTMAWFDAVWDCPSSTWCVGYTFPQGYPPKEYGSAFFAVNSSSRWQQIKQIYVSFSWTGLGSWDLLPEDTVGLCNESGSWCVQVSNLGRGTGVRGGWVDVTSANLWIPPGSWSPAWQVWFRIRPGVLDTGSLPKIRVSLSATSFRYTDGN